MKKLSLFALFFIVAACSTDSSQEDSVLKTNVSERIVPAVIGTSRSSDLSSVISGFEISRESEELLLSSAKELLRLKQEGATYEEVRVYIDDYHNKVLASTITEKEKEILLPLLTIVHFDMYASAETSGGGEKDRDWELSVGRFIVTNSSSTESTSISAVNAEASQINK